MIRGIPNRTSVLDKNLALIAEETTQEFFSYFDYLCSCIPDFVHEEDRQAFIDLMNGEEDGRSGFFRFLRNTGEYRLNLVKVKNLTANVAGKITLIDIDEAIDLDSKLSLELKQCYQVMSVTNDFSFTFSQSTGVFTIKRYIQGRQRLVVEMDFDHWKQQVVEDGIVPEDWAAQLDVLASEIHGSSTSFQVKIYGSIRTGKGMMEDLLFLGSRIEDASGLYVVGKILSDAEASLLRKSNNLLDELQLDELTQVYNKKTITTFAQKKFSTHQISRFALVIIDLDHFKPVNDRYGHMVGDKVLARAATVIKKVVGESGVVGRFGGDEFMLILNSVENDFMLRGILRAILVQVRHEFKGEFEGLELSCSAGAATYPTTGTTYDELFSKADFCLYRAKDKGRDRYIFFRPEMHSELYEASKSAKEAGKQNEGREIVELKYMSQFIAEVGRNPLDACLTVMHHMVDTYSVDNISIYDGKTFKALLSAGGNFTNFSDCPYGGEEGFLDRFDKSGILRCDFTEELLDDGSLYYKTIKERKIGSLLHCLVGDYKNPSAIVSLYRSKTAQWAEYEIHCASIFAGALASVDLTRLLK